ncbi:putative RNA methyltransferase [Actinoalloteichus spitiensis]|uniref:putative RNA methyltransferase n=1 Tax=Actinoalloteichus spitiensis TaxID=252394 RepID=UPI000372F070|nr:methyltransferase domain-containing protein [Actinoalloteichus spitiensis]
MLSDVVDVLACPHCGRACSAVPSGLRCEEGHHFDVARQGYVSLLTGRHSGHGGDTAAMVADRADFLAAGHYAPIRDLVAATAATAVESGGGPARVVEVGAGTGYYLAGVLDRLSRSRGVAVDVSRYAARRAARCHPRAGAVVADAWAGLPVRDHAVDLVLNVFAPRNPVEMRRVLAADGVLLVVTPEDHHLAELVGPLGLVGVDTRKRERVDDQLGAHFRPVERRPLEFGLVLDHAEVRRLVGMGPSAHHVQGVEVSSWLAGQPEVVSVTGAVELSVYRPR